MKIVFFIGLFVLVHHPMLGQMDSFTRWRNARQLYLNGLYKEAEAEYQNAFDKDVSYDSLPEQFQSKYRVGDFEGAVQRYEKESKTRPLTGDEEFNLGNAYFQSSKIDEAIQHYKKAITLNPADKKARHNLSLALRQKKESQNSSKQENKNENNNQNENSEEQQKKFNQNKNQRILDNLAKKELETKSKINTSNKGEAGAKILKAW